MLNPKPKTIANPRHIRFMVALLVFADGGNG
jgi:hypothetical protein